MNTHYIYQPVRFFSLTFLLTWIPWTLAAFFSYQNGRDAFVALFELLGLLGPFLAASIMIRSSNSSKLKKDHRDRLLNFRRIKLTYVPVLLFLMPFALFLSTFLSVFLGKPGTQFSFSAGLASMLPLIILAPTFEELGWRGYGMDSLRSKFTLLTATLLFAVIWAFWHIPLFFINHTYQHTLTTNIIYVVNFFVSVLPAAILANWFYYKNNRSIIVAIAFHMTLVFTSEAFQTEQFTKCIVTVVLMVISFIIIVMNIQFFLEKRKTFL